MQPDNPGISFNYNPTTALGTAGVTGNPFPFSIDYSATGGGVEEGDLAGVISFVQPCLDQFPGVPLMAALDVCGGLPAVLLTIGDSILNVATINGQRHISGGNFPDSTLNNPVGPTLTFSPILGGDAITFNGTTTLGDWVIGNSVIAPAPVVSVPSSSKWSLLLLSLILVLFAARRRLGLR